MRNDIPEDLRRRVERLDPGLRAVVGEFIDVAYPTEDEIQQSQREQARAEWRREATEACRRATLATRALDGEWGDDVRRAVDELVRDVQREVATLAAWGQRATTGDRLTPLEFAAAKAAVESQRVRYALTAAEKLVREADRGRRQTGRPR